MALTTTVEYTTLDEFKEFTPVSSQKTIIEDNWKPFALRAERILDSYVNIEIWRRFNENQNLKFPIKDDDGNSWIPDEIKIAHIEITSDLILKGDPSPANGLIETSESWEGSGYSVTKQKKSSSSSDDIKVEIPPLARRLLMQWTNKVARLIY